MKLTFHCPTFFLVIIAQFLTTILASPTSANVLGRDVSAPLAKPPFKSYIALGDSMSAGPNTGDDVDEKVDDECDRGDGSFGFQLRRNPEFYNGTDEDFVVTACCSAETADVIENQFTAESGFKAEQDVYTITAGGNDLGFSDVIKVCNYGKDIDSNLDCDGVLDKVDEGLKEGSAVRVKLDELYTLLEKSKGDASRVLVVPYIKLYNAETRLADEVEDHCKPKKEVRIRLNAQVDQGNAVLREHALKHGLEFVDDKALQEKFNGHRFCEAKDTEKEDWFQDNFLDGVKFNDGLFHPTEKGYTAYAESVMAHVLA